MSVLVIDVGTSGLRAAIVRPDATIGLERHVRLLPDSPMPGLVEFDAAVMATTALDVARAVLAEGGPVDAVGVTNQRASTIVWDRATGEPVAPALGWQDLRTVGDCLMLQADGIRLLPNASATKLRNILDTADPDRTRDLCFGTVDTWLLWHLTNGDVHATDVSNATATGLLLPDVADWDDHVLEVLRVPRSMLPKLVDSSGTIGAATALDGAPPICGVAGDQQASLIGQGCVRPGLAKITFGTGGMLDLCLGEDHAIAVDIGAAGTFPLVAWRHRGRATWMLEAIMLSAGTNVEWLRDDLGMLTTAEESDEVAGSVASTDGVVYVPALMGLGAPHLDFGARGTLLGITRGTTRAHVVRAVLEGIAHRGADLVEAAEAATGMAIASLRVDGGMTRNHTFTQALADATQRSVEISPVVEATALGAAFLAGLEVGIWNDWDDLAATWKPTEVIEPKATLDRAQWARAIERAKGWLADFSALQF